MLTTDVKEQRTRVPGQGTVGLMIFFNVMLVFLAKSIPLLTKTIRPLTAKRSIPKFGTQINYQKHTRIHESSLSYVCTNGGKNFGSF